MILGDWKSTEFKTVSKEKGQFFGTDHVLNGDTKSVELFEAGERKQKLVQPKIYLHIAENFLSSVTYFLRATFLSWRWKTAFLSTEGDLKKVLVCTSPANGKLSSRQKMLLGKDIFTTKLIEQNSYEEILGHEFLALRNFSHDQNKGRYFQRYKMSKNQPLYHNIKITHPLGEFFGAKEFATDAFFCPIYRAKSISSFFKYHYLKIFSKDWKEVSLKVDSFCEKMLVREKDEKSIILYLKDKKN